MKSAVSYYRPESHNVSIVVSSLFHIGISKFFFFIICRNTLCSYVKNKFKQVSPTLQVQVVHFQSYCCKLYVAQICRSLVIWIIDFSLEFYYHQTGKYNAQEMMFSYRASLLFCIILHGRITLSVSTRSEIMHLHVIIDISTIWKSNWWMWHVEGPK